MIECLIRAGGESHPGKSVVHHRAKLRQVTSETLRYYDRIGLITPDYVDPQTRYRYYSIRQYEKLGTIKELRQLGMSIHDITHYFLGRI